MSHQRKIIQDLIAWIDEHIDQPLNIDVVAKNQAIRGQLQRMFHGDASDAWRLHSPTPPVTGRVRTTERPIFDIAMDLGYVCADKRLSRFPSAV